MFAAALGEQLGADLGTDVTIEVPEVMATGAQYDDILGGRSALALLRPVAYVFAHGRDPRIVAACVADRSIDGVVGSFYFGQVYAHRDTGITSLDQLDESRAGQLTMAYGSRFSTSNFLVPANVLRTAADVHPFLHFRRTDFTGGHDLAAAAVHEGRADLGAGHDGVIALLAQQALDVFWGGVKDLSPTVHENYASIEHALANLHLTEPDMLR